MPKIDGVACTLRYDVEGRLFLAATRGDGKQGDDITQNALAVEDIPNQVPKDLVKHNLADGKTYMEVRGEVFMLLSRFQQHFAEDFANPRNLAAGALKQKDPQKTRDAGLSFFPYGAMHLKQDSEQAKVTLLGKMGFREIPALLVGKSEELTEGYWHFARQRAALDYETDGVVIRADAVSEQARLGETAHHPKWAIAYKFQGESAQSSLVEVIWSLGRTGVITPVAVVAPVAVSGATVTKASLHNLAILQSLGLTRGALVEVVRRGGVIPHVERVLSAGQEPIEVPDICPSCGGGTAVAGDFLYCAKPAACPSVVKGQVAYFCSVIDLQGLGDKHLSGLIESGLLRTPADLYALTADQLLTLERMGPKLAAKIVLEIESKKTLAPAVFLAALGIPEVGPTVAATLCDAFGGFKPLMTVNEDQIQQVHGMGDAIAKSLVSGLRERANEIESLLTRVTLVQPPKNTSGDQRFADLSFVFTGKMAHMDRKSAQKAVTAYGGKTPSGVSKELNYLVVGDDGSPLWAKGKSAPSRKKHKACKTKVRPFASSARRISSKCCKRIPNRISKRQAPNWSRANNSSSFDVHRGIGKSSERGKRRFSKAPAWDHHHRNTLKKIRKRVFVPSQRVLFTQSGSRPGSADPIDLSRWFDS